MNDIDEKYVKLGEDEECVIGGTKFIVKSYANSQSDKTAEQLLLEMIKNKIINGKV